MEKNVINEKFESDLINILKEIQKMLIEKRHDYGNNYEVIREKYGEITSLVRLHDKFNRLEQLIIKNKQPKNESVTDTLFDIIGYAILELMYRKTT